MHVTGATAVRAAYSAAKGAPLAHVLLLLTLLLRIGWTAGVMM